MNEPPKTLTQAVDDLRLIRQVLDQTATSFRTLAPEFFRMGGGLAGLRRPLLPGHLAGYPGLPLPRGLRRVGPHHGVPRVLSALLPWARVALWGYLLVQCILWQRKKGTFPALGGRCWASGRCCWCSTSCCSCCWRGASSTTPPCPCPLNPQVLPGITLGPSSTTAGSSCPSSSPDPPGGHWDPAVGAAAVCAGSGGLCPGCLFRLRTRAGACPGNHPPPVCLPSGRGAGPSVLPAGGPAGAGPAPPAPAGRSVNPMKEPTPNLTRALEDLQVIRTVLDKASPSFQTLAASFRVLGILWLVPAGLLAFLQGGEPDQLPLCLGPWHSSVRRPQPSPAPPRGHRPAGGGVLPALAGKKAPGGLLPRGGQGDHPVAGAPPALPRVHRGRDGGHLLQHRTGGDVLPGLAGWVPDLLRLRGPADLCPCALPLPPPC